MSYAAPEWTHLCTFRYCLGRMSVIVSTCTDWLRRDWMSLDKKTRVLIRRELQEAVEYHLEIRETVQGGITNLGMDCDAKAWIRLLEDIKKMEGEK